MPQRAILIILLAGLFPLVVGRSVYTAPNLLFNRPVFMEIESGLTALDGPKIFPYPNSSSYDG